MNIYTKQPMEKTDMETNEIKMKSVTIASRNASIFFALTQTQPCGKERHHALVLLGKMQLLTG